MNFRTPLPVATGIVIILVKYVAIILPAIFLIVTAHPGEFAASLNRIGGSCTAACPVSLTLRYIPDIRRDCEAVSRSRQARGPGFSRRALWFRRLKRTVPLLPPLIFSSRERIDVISRAMELRGFGRHGRRSRYSANPFSRADILTVLVSAVIFAAGIRSAFLDGNRFSKPFV